MREITTDAAVLERFVSLPGRDVLDVGCGTGALVRAMCEEGASVTGLEISEDQLAVARENDRTRVARYVVGRAERLPLADASVDVVVFMRTLHHVAVDQLTVALREARRVLRGDGVLYVAEPVPKGDFFELVSLVDDERNQLSAVREALERAREGGWRRVASLDYALEGRLGGVDEFRALMVSVDPGRLGILAEREAGIAAAFAELGQPGVAPSERRFQQPMRVDVLGFDQ